MVGEGGIYNFNFPLTVWHQFLWVIPEELRKELAGLGS